ncbi:MAG: gliding motility-associated C-terminal domain-containing protein [Dysgonamonadaceae bacterium]|jgi:gliding motility-associated-like protein|nr:gliding motility-associated C-terminal domain-containing protein [Dysgonamonadaceae bacterium]
MITKLKVLLIFTGLLSAGLVAGQYSVRGGKGTPLLARSDLKYGIDVYLLDGLEGAKVSFTSDKAGTHKWFKYCEKASDAEPVECLQSGYTSTIYELEDGWGYFVESPETLWRYVWIIDYSKYVPKFFGMDVQNDGSECDFLNLVADVEAEPLEYVLPSSNVKFLERDYILSYTALEWDKDAKEFFETDVQTTFIHLNSMYLENPPLKNTVFTLSGDEYARHFGYEQSVSLEYEAVAIESHATAETDRAYPDNEVHDSGSDLGGSAPVEYLFTAYANEPLAGLFIWKVDKVNPDKSTTNVAIFKNKEFKYRFEEEGTFSVNLEVSGAATNCVDMSNSFNVNVGETFVKIPNAFSPGSSPGVNDEFRISYRSVVSFRASIFNRWGNLLYRWTDPSKGWDGRVNGKLVPTGAYYVIVEYTDAKGKRHTESRDVNILISSK